MTQNTQEAPPGRRVRDARRMHLEMNIKSEFGADATDFEGTIESPECGMAQHNRASEHRGASA